MKRILIGLLALVSAVFFPVWVTCIIALVLAVCWEAWEVILIGVLLDVLYMPPTVMGFVPMPATLVAIVLVWIMIPIRSRLLVERG